MGSDDCAIDSYCTNTVGGFSCLTCSANECVVVTVDCDTNAAPTQLEASRVLGPLRDGETCSDIDECVVGTVDCDTNAVCTNTAGGFSCACHTGLEGDGETYSDIDECVFGTVYDGRFLLFSEFLDFSSSKSSKLPR